MNITLIENGTDKTYIAGFVSGMIFRKAIQMEKQIQTNGLNVEVLDELVAFVVEIFGGQFTSEQFYNGVKASEMMDILLGTIRTCITGATNKEKH